MLLALANCERRHHSVIFLSSSPFRAMGLLCLTAAANNGPLLRARECCNNNKCGTRSAGDVWASKCNKQYMKRIVNNRRLSERNNETPTDWLTHMLKCSSRACYYYFAVLMRWIRWAAHTQHARWHSDAVDLDNKNQFEVGSSKRLFEALWIERVYRTLPVWPIKANDLIDLTR